MPRVGEELPSPSTRPVLHVGSTRLLPTGSAWQPRIPSMKPEQNRDPWPLTSTLPLIVAARRANLHPRSERAFVEIRDLSLAWCLGTPGLPTPPPPGPYLHRQAPLCLKAQLRLNSEFSRKAWKLSLWAWRRSQFRGGAAGVRGAHNQRVRSSGVLGTTVEWLSLAKGEILTSTFAHLCG